jgi:fibronectin-binding autotransporter adhesin
MPTKSSMRRARRNALVAAVTAVLTLTLQSRGDTFNWLPTAFGPFNWNNADGQDNWDVPEFPNAAGDVANITSDLTEPMTILLNEPITLGVLNVGDTIGSHLYTIDPGIGGGFVFDNLAADAEINQTATSAGARINAPIETAGNLTLSSASAAPLVIAGALQSSAVTGTQTVRITNGNVNISGSLQDGAAGGVVAVVKDGAGTLTLNGLNAFSGGVTLNAGNLDIGSATALGNNASILTINGGTLQNTSFGPIVITTGNPQLWSGDFAFTGASDLDLGTGVAIMSATRQINVTAGTLAVSGQVLENGAGFGITKTGAGSLALAGANAFSGPVTVNGGYLVVRHAAALGTGTAHTVNTGGTMTLDGGVTVTGKTLSIIGDGVIVGGVQNGAFRGTNGDNVWNGDISANTSVITRIVAGSGTLTINGNITTSGTAANGLVFQGTGTVNGVISGDASVTRSNNDPGVWTFNGANTYTGVTTISNGAILMGNANALQNSALTVNSAVPGGLRFAAGIGNFNLVSLAGAGAASIALNDSVGDAVSLTVGSANTSTTFAGALSGPGSLVKTGTGTLTLSGPVSASGGTLVNSGTLVLSGANTFTGSVSVGAATLTGSDATAMGASASNLRTVLGNGTIALNAGALLRLRANGTNDSSSQVLNFGGSVAVFGAATINVDRQGANGGTGKFLRAGNLTLGSELLTVTSNNSFSVQFGTATLVDNATVNFGTATGNVVLGNVVESGGARSLTKTGAGRMVIVGSASHTGGTNVDAGTLQIGLGGYSGSLVGNIANAAAVILSRADAITFEGVISGAGSLTKQGSGTLTLKGANTYAGTTTIGNGTLELDYTNSANVLNPATSLALADTLVIKGAPTGTTSQSFSGFSTTALFPGRIIVDRNGGEGTTLTLPNLWTIGGSNTLLLDLSKGGAIASSPILSNGVITASALANAVARTFVKGLDQRTYFATTAGGMVVPQTNLVALPATGGSGTVNYGISGHLVTTGAVTTNTLRIDTTAGPGSLDISGGNFSASRTALMMDGDFDFEIKRTSGAGTMPNIVIMQNGNGALYYNAPIATDGGFTKGGKGLLVGGMTSGSPTAITLTEGVYRAATPAALPTGNLAISGGIFEMGAGDFIGSVGGGNGQVRIIADGGFSAFGGTRVVNLGGAGATQPWGATDFLPNNSTLYLSSPHSDSTVDFRNPLLLGGITRTVQVNNGSAAVDAQLSGNVQGTAELVKTGPGTLALSAANTFSGTVSLREGEISLTGSLAGRVEVVSGTLSGNGDGSTLGVSMSGFQIGNGIGANDAVLSPGGGIGKLTTGGALNFSLDGVFRFELDFASSLADQVIANGITIDPAAVFQPIELGATVPLTLGTMFVVLQNNSFAPIEGHFAGLEEGSMLTFGLNTFEVSYGGGDGNDMSLVAVVPEPATSLMMLFSCGLLGLRRSRAKLRG